MRFTQLGTSTGSLRAGSRAHERLVGQREEEEDEGLAVRRFLEERRAHRRPPRARGAAEHRQPIAKALARRPFEEVRGEPLELGERADAANLLEPHVSGARGDLGAPVGRGEEEPGAREVGREVLDRGEGLGARAYLGVLLALVDERQRVLGVSRREDGDRPFRPEPHGPLHVAPGDLQEPLLGALGAQRDDDLLEVARNLHARVVHVAVPEVRNRVLHEVVEQRHHVLRRERAHAEEHAERARADAEVRHRQRAPQGGDAVVVGEVGEEVERNDPHVPRPRFVEHLGEAAADAGELEPRELRLLGEEETRSRLHVPALGDLHDELRHLGIGRVHPQPGVHRGASPAARQGAVVADEEPREPHALARGERDETQGELRGLSREPLGGLDLAGVGRERPGGLDAPGEGLAGRARLGADGLDLLGGGHRHGRRRGRRRRRRGLVLDERQRLLDARPAPRKASGAHLVKFVSVAHASPAP